MVSHARLAWLSNEIWKGRSASVSFTFNAVNQREKVKFVLGEEYGIANSVYRPVLLSAILQFRLPVSTALSPTRDIVQSQRIKLL